MRISKTYLNELKKRGKESRVYRKYQLVGLELAKILEDEKHKSLYIKLAKGGNGETLIRLAKEIREKKAIRKKGAYFMSCLAPAERKALFARTKHGE